jgi:glucan biosynthesis protein
VVFPENFSTFSNALWNKHVVLHAVVTNGAATGVKALTVGLRASKTGATNDVDAITQEIHLGWASETATAGLVDYPNVTYQDHNEVALRAPWIYNLVDDGTGWYMQQSPRGSATIEPLDLFHVAQSNWTQRTYDETLFTWSHAASGVRSLFDDDQTYRLRGAVAYHVGLKVGHQYGTNDLGESNYPEVLNLRGNGYFRMADYDGVMAGSFRPMASDLFGLYKGKKNEDAPLMTKAYAHVVPATSPTNDNSYGQVFASLRSKTNQFFIGIAQADLHFAPQEVAASGCYFDLQAETWAHQANIVTQHGPFSLFAQVSMHWRGGPDINDGTEGHDVDCVMVKKADGEWVTHQILNPPTNVFHRTVATFRSNDTVYLQQQDRGRDSYGFATETPYKRASSFEITMLNDGGLPLDLDVYEENASSEINDNIDIACNVRSNLTAKQNLKYAYRYRTIYAPGVTVLSPAESGGGEGWSNDTFRIEFLATDGHDEPLVAELYYGNGRDADWRLINTNVVLYVPTNTHRLAYDWNTAGVATGAYYIKVAARRATGGKTGFDVSNTRLQVGRATGLQRNAGVVSTVTTNTLELGTNLSFEAGTAGWVAAADHLAIGATNTYAFHGTNAARFSGSWTGWSWNNLRQDIACQPGEVLHVTGKVRIQGLTRGGADWVGAGIKLEASDGSSATEQSFNETSATNTWLSVDFYRTAAGATERLILWVAGNDCPNANVYFDDFRVVSTNGAVITNSVSSGYWVAATSINVTAHNALCLWAGGTNGTAGAGVWVADASGVTNTVVLTNHIDRLVSLEQRIEIPWSAFAGVNKAQIRALGFTSSNLSASRVRSAWLPLAARARVRAAPQADPEGLSLYYPGQVMTNVITITNFTATAQTNLTVQVVQEYGETRWWWDESPHVAPRWSAKSRRGDRLAGGFEQVWTNRTLPAGGVLVLTNIYVNPSGRLVTQYYGSNDAPWYAFRNYQSRAQVHVAVRRANGDNVYDSDGAGCYRVDDDSTQTNNTEEAGSGSSSLLAYSSFSSSSSSSPDSPSSAPSSSRLVAPAVPEIVVAGGPQGVGRPAAASAPAPARAAARLEDGRSLPFADDFSGGLKKGWSVVKDPNVIWSVSDGALSAAAGGQGGYAYALVQGLAIRGDNVSMEFDVMFDEAAREGGLIYRGRVLQVNPTVCGWEDADPRYIVGCPLLTPGAWHRVAVDIRESPLGALSDLFIDGVPVFYDEPVEPGAPSAPFGFLSPYSGGTVRWDNVDVYHP